MIKLSRICSGKFTLLTAVVCSFAQTPSINDGIVFSGTSEKYYIKIKDIIYSYHFSIL